MAAFSPAIVASLQARLSAARAAGNVAEANRILGLFQKYGISQVAPSSEPGAYAIAGDVVRVPYRQGDIVANDLLVTSADQGMLRGTVGSVVRANGNVTSWWTDGPRMTASARLPVTMPRSSVQHVWRNGRLVI